jgi:hypothetical protein
MDEPFVEVCMDETRRALDCHVSRVHRWQFVADTGDMTIGVDWCWWHKWVSALIDWNSGSSVWDELRKGGELASSSLVLDERVGVGMAVSQMNVRLPGLSQSD